MTDNTILWNLLEQWKKVDLLEHNESRSQLEHDILKASSSINHEVTSVLYCGLALSDEDFEKLGRGEIVNFIPESRLMVWSKSYKVGEKRAKELAEVYGFNSVMLAYIPSILGVVMDIDQLHWMRGTEAFKSHDVLCETQPLVLNQYNTILFNYSDYL